MLWGYQFPNVATNSHNSGLFDLLSTSYTALADRSPSPGTLFTTAAPGSQVLTIDQGFNTTDGSLDFNTMPYPYLLLGVVNIGNGPFEGQLLPSFRFTLNGKWGDGGFVSGNCALGPSGYASGWAVIPRSVMTTSTPTTTLELRLGANFTTALGNFGVGEIIICGANEIPLAALSDAPFDPSHLKRATGNRGWPLLRQGFRKTSAQLTPQTRADVYGETSTRYTRPLQSMVLDAARSRCHAIAPLWRTPGTTAAHTPTLIQNARMARMVDPLPNFDGKATENHYSGALNFEELL